MAGEREVLDVGPDVEGAGDPVAARVQHDGRGVEGDGRGAQVGEVAPGAAAHVQADGRPGPTRVGERLGIRPAPGGGVGGGPLEPPVLVDVDGGPLHGARS